MKKIAVKISLFLCLSIASQEADIEKILKNNPELLSNPEIIKLLREGSSFDLETEATGEDISVDFETESEIEFGYEFGYEFEFEFEFDTCSASTKESRGFPIEARKLVV